MKLLPLIAVLALLPLPIAAPAAAPAAVAQDAVAPLPAAPEIVADPVGFSLELPEGWERVRVPAAADDPATGCSHLVFTLRTGRPASILVAVAQPFACTGRKLKERDLAGFTAETSASLASAFQLSAPFEANFPHGAHRLWLERAQGHRLGSGDPVTVETVCGILRDGSACWMVVAADEATRLAFEQLPVALDGERALPLVPAGALPR